MTLEQAKKKYPAWYERVIVQGDTSRQYWDIAGKVHGKDPYALYHWWLRKARSGVEYRHRYFCVMCLAIYAAKNDVPYELLKKDAYELLAHIQESVVAPEPFTEKDVESALECYDKRYSTFPTDDISKLSGIPIKKNLRKGRSQATHLRLARFARDVLYEEMGKDWRGPGPIVGSSPKKKVIEEWQALHPDGKPKDCISETGYAKTTVYRYWQKKR